MAADNVKTAFRVPSEINEDFIRTLSGNTTNNNSSKKISTNSNNNNNKISTNSHQSCFEIYTGKDLYWSLFLINFQVFNLQLYQ